MTEDRNKKKPKKRSERNNSKGKKIFKIVSLTLMFLVLTAIVTVAGYAFAVIKDTEPLDLKQVTGLAEQSTIYDSDKKIMDKALTSDEERELLNSKDIPQVLKDAYVSIEDERFYDHQGIDVKRILGAFVFNVKSVLSGSDTLQGGSTLTQQLIKNTVLTNEKSIVRKIKEAYLSIELENQMSKDEILTAYLNTIPLGGIQYGVETASQRYFNKNASELNLIESAYLAGITQSPGSLDAFTEKNIADPSRYITRVKTVLSKMLELGKISDSEHNTAIADLDGGKLVFTETVRKSSFNYEWFTRPALEQVEEDLISKLGYTKEEAKHMVDKGGLEIYTTMDRKLQDSTQEVLNNRSNLGIPGSDIINEDGIPTLQASAVITDYKTGQVKAMIGGRGDQPGASLNRAYDVLKSTGSSSKPLTAYAPAIDTKLLNTVSVFDDAPFEPELKKRYGSPGPNNYGGGFSGYTTLKEGIKRSLNPIAAKTVDKVGLKTAVSYGEKFGLTYGEGSKTISATALGEFQNAANEPDGGNAYQMANAFGAFGNGGIVTEGILYTEVKDSTGKVILKAEPKKTQAVSEQTAYILYDMMRGSVASTAHVSGISTVGKTGTTTDNKSYLFSGLTPYYSASVWIGYDKPQPLPGGSTHTAGKLFGKIMNPAHAGLAKTSGIKRPTGIINITACADSGLIPTALCSRDSRGSRVVSGLGLPGSQPKSYCDNHVSVKINKLNNMLANANTPASLIEERVFIKKDYIHRGVGIKDYQYLAPSAADTMTEIPVEETEDPDLENPDGGITPDGDGTVEPDTDGGATTPPVNPVPPNPLPPVPPVTPPTPPNPAPPIVE